MTTELEREFLKSLGLKQDILIQCMNYIELLKPFVRDMFE